MEFRLRYLNRDRKVRHIIEKLVAVLIMIANCYWLRHNINLVYWYQFTELDIFIRLPNWLIGLHIIACFVGFAIGVKAFQDDIPTLKAIGMNALLGVFLFAIEMLVI